MEALVFGSKLHTFDLIFGIKTHKICGRDIAYIYLTSDHSNVTIAYQRAQYAISSQLNQFLLKLSERLSLL